MKTYQIMHLERPIASVGTDGGCVVDAPEFMPYNLYLEQNADDLDTRLNNLNNFYYWCASRVLTLDRRYAKEILNSLGLKQTVTDRDRAEIALRYHAVSMTDVYWVREAGEQTRFAEINLYRHSLSDAFVDVSLLGKSLTAQNAELLDARDAAGDVTTGGMAPKAWVRRDGSFLLLKDGSREEVKAELLASRIARCFRVDQVLYEPMTFKGQPVSACRLMTSLAYSIVPAEYVEIYAVNHDTTLRELVRRYDDYGFHMMNIVDYLVGNTDRHWGNWGFLTDNRTNCLLKLHPLMDLNRAFRAYDTLDGTRCQTVEGNRSQREAAEEAVRTVGLNQVSPIDPEWFEEEQTKEMFFARLEALRRQEAASWH